MVFFHQSVCISPQNSFPVPELSKIRESEANQLRVNEPDFTGIPPAVKRRMGKSVRMAVGAALTLMENQPAPDGLIIATANGGMEDCIKFLNQILEYNEGLLTPASFVQSTSNAAAAQIALITKNHNYNITHVHRGLAFENALLDGVMALAEHPSATFLLGATDEISAYNYNIDQVAGWYRKEEISNTALFEKPALGTIAGEGSFMVRINQQPSGASATLLGIKTLHSTDPRVVTEVLTKFLRAHLPEGEEPDLLLSGENGDERFLPFYDAVEQHFQKSVSVARFKSFCGEYTTASAFACWLALQILETGRIPDQAIKKRGSVGQPRRILIYNGYQGKQHAFILMQTPADR